MRRWMFLLALPAFVMAAPATREMVLKSSDGFTLKGTLTLPEGKDRKPVVILAHQYKSDRKGWDALAAELHARGLGTLAIDLRGHGASTDKNGAVVAVADDFSSDAVKVGFTSIPGDLELVAKWLREQKDVDKRRLGLAGSSVGGFSVLLAAPQVHPVAVLALSPAGSEVWGKSSRDRLVEAVKKGASATFILSSEGDADAAENLKVLKGLPGVHGELLEGNEHGFAYLPKRKDTMAVFFAEYLHRRIHAAAAKAPDKSEAPAKVARPVEAKKPASKAAKH